MRKVEVVPYNSEWSDLFESEALLDEEQIFTNDFIMNNELAIFEKHTIRRTYDKKTEMWFFSVVDIIQVLTQQPDYQTARKYWNKLKSRLNKEES